MRSFLMSCLFLFAVCMSMFLSEGAQAETFTSPLSPLAEPTISTISPNSAQEGDVVVISGQNFGDEMPEKGFVAFGVGNLVPRDVAKVVFWTDTEVRVEVPQLTKPLNYNWEVFLGLGDFGPFSNWVRFEPQEPSKPRIAVLDFQGTPQWYTPSIINAGTITVTADLNGHQFGVLDEGRVTFVKDDGRVYKIQNVWTHKYGNIYEWVQYIIDGTVSFWIDTETSIEVEGFGPWQLREDNKGWDLTEHETTLQFSFEGPQYKDYEGQYDPTWDWVLKVSPTWAAQQYPWLDTVIDLPTNCDGKGTNHNGEFFWNGVRPDQVFGNGVFRQWINEPLVDSIATVSAAGWEVEVPTQGPSCWNSISYLPNVNSN